VLSRELTSLWPVCPTQGVIRIAVCGGTRVPGQVVYATLLSNPFLSPSFGTKRMPLRAEAKSPRDPPAADTGGTRSPGLGGVVLEAPRLGHQHTVLPPGALCVA
jgi:hypothetical protein